jgi:hypothetical protein
MKTEGYLITDKHNIKVKCRENVKKHEKYKKNK